MSQCIHCISLFILGALFLGLLHREAAFSWEQFSEIANYWWGLAFHTSIRQSKDPHGNQPLLPGSSIVGDNILCWSSRSWYQTNRDTPSVLQPASSIQNSQSQAVSRALPRLSCVKYKSSGPCFCPPLLPPDPSWSSHGPASCALHAEPKGL